MKNKTTKIYYNDPDKFDKSNSKNDCAANILIESMFELWIKKQNIQDQCIIFMLKLGYKDKEIGDTLNINRQTVYRHKRRLKDSLKAFIK